MRFTKMHGLGNDYLYVYGPVPDNVKELCVRLSHRHFGAGSDGMIYISPSNVADFMMRIFNADGSEAKMCGNGIRCVGKYVYDKKLTRKTHLKVETLSGIKTLDLAVENGVVREVSVQMGEAQISESLRLVVENQEIDIVPVCVGNDHAVYFVPDAETSDVARIGPIIERSSVFPHGVNAEFVQVLSKNELRMRVWERGSGITMACGTGACASAAAAVSRGFCPFDTPISVRLDGGELIITVSREMRLTMTGSAETVYEGETNLC